MICIRVLKAVVRRCLGGGRGEEEQPVLGMSRLGVVNSSSGWGVTREESSLEQAKI